MTAFRNAMVDGDGRLHVTTSGLRGGLTLCHRVVAAVTGRPAASVPVVTCEVCHRVVNRMATTAHSGTAA